MNDQSPWWLTDGADRLAVHEDPVTVHLAARAASVRRNGFGSTIDHGDGSNGDDEAGDGNIDDAAGDQDSPRAARSTHGPDDHGDPAACQACPICRGLAMLRRTNPEAVGHLAHAIHHLSLAMRAFSDTMAADGADTAAARGTAMATNTDDGFESIPLDDPPPTPPTSPTTPTSSAATTPNVATPNAATP